MSGRAPASRSSSSPTRSKRRCFSARSLIVMSPRPGRIVARFDLNFVNAFARDRDARAVKTAPEFAGLREQIRAIVHQNEPYRSAAQ